MTSDERLRELEEKYDGYKVYDNRGEKIGKVDDLFVDEADREEYVGVKMGFLGTKSTLIPMDVIRVNEGEKALEVAESKDRIKDAPSFDDDEDITPEYEERIRRHFGLEPRGGSVSGGGARDERPANERPANERPANERPANERPANERPAGERPADERREDARSGRDEERELDRESDLRGEERGSSGVDTSYGERAGSAPADRNESRETPVSRTEETETVEEGGRTRVRRRIVREEIVEEGPEER